MTVWVSAILHDTVWIIKQQEKKKKHLTAVIFQGKTYANLTKPIVLMKAVLLHVRNPRRTVWTIAERYKSTAAVAEIAYCMYVHNIIQWL